MQLQEVQYFYSSHNRGVNKYKIARMKSYTSTIIITGILIFSISCKNSQGDNRAFLKIIFNSQAEQVLLQVKDIEKTGKILYPRTVDNGKVRYIEKEDWTSGFFPGTLWLLYDLTSDPIWRNYALDYTESLDSVKYLTEHHDIGFMIQCSFGNGIRLGEQNYNDVILQAAKSLSTRYRPKAGIIQSWNVDRGWQSERGWECPVIIDNMMNLELLFRATELSGDSSSTILPSATPIILLQTTIERIIVPTMWLITVCQMAQSEAKKQPRDMLMKVHGPGARPGEFMGSQFVTGKPVNPNISTRREKLPIL